MLVRRRNDFETLFNTENRMKQVLYVLIVAISMMVVLSGCDLTSDDEPSKPPPVSGNDLVINEVFTLPPDRHYAYSWIEIYNPTGTRIRWFDQVFPATFTIFGQGGLFEKTTDDGGTWSTVSTSISANINDVTYPYADTAYAIGNGGSIWRSNDAGVTWTPMTSPTTKDLYDIEFPSASIVPNSRTAWIVGQDGVILRTTDRNGPWTLLRSPTTRDLHSISFTNFANLYICGKGGTVYKSGNVGSSWTNVAPSGATADFYRIDFMARDTGWVMGSNGTIYRTYIPSTSEVIWTPLPTPANAKVTYRGSSFRSSSVGFQQGLGWVVGDSGVVIKTTNMGDSWTKIDVGTTANLKSINFVDPRRGWILGDNGTIIATVDSGKRWAPLTAPNAKNIAGGVFFRLSVRVARRYVLEFTAKRKEFFFDPLTGRINFDFFTKIDSGVVLYDPQILSDQGVEPAPPVPGNGFTIINSDSGAFKDHTNLGPGSTNVQNVAIGYYNDTTSVFGFRPVLWDLLEAGELRLVKFYLKEDLNKLPGDPDRFFEFTSEVVDVVRYGGYRPAPDPFPTNVPAAAIPEWWSLSRYADDVGERITTASTAKSFYLNNKPIPGWTSQRFKSR